LWRDDYVIRSQWWMVMSARSERYATCLAMNSLFIVRLLGCRIIA